MKTTLSLIAGVVAALSVAPANARQGQTTRIRSVLAERLKVKPSQVRFRSYRVGAFSSSGSMGQRRYVQWSIRGKEGTAEVGLIGGRRGTTRLMNVHHGKADAKVLKGLAARFGGDPDLYHSLRQSPVSPEEAYWNAKYPGPSAIMKKVHRTKGATDAIHYELRLGRQLVGYATDIFVETGSKLSGKRVFFNTHGRQVSQHSFVPPQ